MAEFVKTIVNGTYEIILPKHRADRPEWYTDYGWEKKRLDHMHSLIMKGDVVFYVGAEEGEMPALCQMWGAKVFMFEPNDKVWPNIKGIWEANKLEMPLGCFSGFASNTNSGDYITMSLHSFPSSANGEIISDHGFKELIDAGNIPQVKIDAVSKELLVLEKKIPTIISIDVEGSEFEVLKGAEKTINSFHPTIYLSLHPEFSFRIYGKYGAEIRKWIIDHGYKEELIDYPLHECHLVYTQK